jgi:dTMP kinase
LFDVPTAVAAQRLARARAPDRFERERTDFHARVRAAYLRRAEQYPRRFRVIDSTRSLEAIRAELAGILEGL